MEGRAPARPLVPSFGVAGAPPSRRDRADVRRNWKVNKPAAMVAIAIVSPTILRPVFLVIDFFGSISDSSLMPSGVNSNAHDKTRATGKHSTSSATRTFIAHGGASKVGKSIEAAWMSSQETTM